jgi:hypothetical protein
VARRGDEVDDQLWAWDLERLEHLCHRRLAARDQFSLRVGQEQQPLAPAIANSVQLLGHLEHRARPDHLQLLLIDSLVVNDGGGAVVVLAFKLHHCTPTEPEWRIHAAVKLCLSEAHRF